MKFIFFINFHEAFPLNMFFVYVFVKHIYQINANDIEFKARFELNFFISRLIVWVQLVLLAQYDCILSHEIETTNRSPWSQLYWFDHLFSCISVQSQPWHHDESQQNNAKRLSWNHLSFISSFVLPTFLCHCKEDLNFLFFGVRNSFFNNISTHHGKKW